MPQQPSRIGPLPVDPLHVDLTAAAVRALVGTALLVAPRRAGRLLVGDLADEPAVAVLARAAGIRDLALAIHAVWALDRPDDLTRNHRLTAVVDATDAVAAALAFGHLDRRGRWLAVTGGSAAAVGGYLQSLTWRRSEPEVGG